ncbi:M61 family metallopeptidase [Robertkochia flava]|uniref:M61 family metallopeptidase n=1 Tax=Robertkochia flava TaxID=3447986 RepID=UPI001CCE645A|nr:peptidase M61 [Robertkochia marina]
MNKFLGLVSGLLVLSCTPKFNDMADDLPVKAHVDLVHTNEDRVKVEIDPGRFAMDTVVFLIPKTVPGTYSIDNYGQYIEDLRALDYSGRELEVIHEGENRWMISSGKDLDKLVYYANDTFDTEQEKDDPVFSPAGTNIEQDQNYFLNLHMIIGYFKGYDRRPYEIEFLKPEGFTAATSLTRMAGNSNTPGTDTFYASRYFEVTDNPVMYARPDTERFMVNDIEVTLSVYSPSKVYSAFSLRGDMEAMMQAQKQFLGDLDATKKYNILLFLSDLEQDAPTGFGALEHHTSTTVVLPESMPKPMLVETMVDVVSHEFFHIVTPLSIHSKEVHYFNYNEPEMSQHLWMYEGVTEYFAQLFQINQGLIQEEEFYARLLEKIENSKRFDDTMSFTEMSTNILEDPYKNNYANVYEKGALIAMCMDIIIREQSQGERGILSLMKDLAAAYGTEKPFEDQELFDIIVEKTYPEIGQFIDTYVKGTTPIPYEVFLNKVGLTLTSVEISTPSYFFRTEEDPFIDASLDGDIFVREMTLNSFFTSMGLEPGDIIKKINGVSYNLDNAQDLIMTSFQWQEGETLNMEVMREDKNIRLRGEVVAPLMQTQMIIPTGEPDPKKDEFREAWLKG